MNTFVIDWGPAMVTILLKEEKTFKKVMYILTKTKKQTSTTTKKAFCLPKENVTVD